MKDELKQAVQEAAEEWVEAQDCLVVSMSDAAFARVREAKDSFTRALDKLADTPDHAKLEGLLEAVRETLTTLPPTDLRDSSHRRRLQDALAAFEGREGEL